MHLSQRWTLLLLIFFLVFTISLFQGQQPAASPATCAAPSLSTINGANIFSAQQEEWLGEIMAHDLEKDFKVIADPDGRLEKIGARLLAQLPPTGIHYRFTIIDFPINNAFSSAGGRVYVSRRLIELAQSEDDLAAVVAHEIGHGISHQIVIEFSDLFRSIGVSQLGDRQDVIDKWNQILDTEAKGKYKVDEKRHEQGEMAADRIGLYAMMRAGYDPRHAFDFFDRVTQMKGNTGGFWSDLFHQTKPESKRLREMLRNSAPLPAECITALPADNGTQFVAWQKAVLESQFAAAKEEIPGLIRKTLLKSPLRGDLQQIQFSPDGNYLLAQDDSSVFVLSHEPLANLFRIDAPEAYHAQFTPDSHSIVFYDKELRVQKWDVAKHERSSIHQVNAIRDCLESALSPSGEVLACVSLGNEEEAQFDVQLIDVASSEVFYTHKKFYTPNFFEFLILGLADLQQGEPFKMFNIGFSPDDHYFLLGHAQATLGYDLKNRTTIKLSGRLKDVAGYSFAFLAPDQVAGYEPTMGVRKIQIVRFPSGELVESFVAPAIGEIAAPGKGNYVLVRNAGKYPVVVVDLAEKKLVSASKAPGFAIYDQVHAGETVGGELALFHPVDNKVISRVTLPDSPLEQTSASGFSSNGKWVALSGRTRGGIWNLESGERIFLVQGFQGALFDQDQLIAQFPPKDPDPSRVIKLDIPSHTMDELYKLEADKTKSQFNLFPLTITTFLNSYSRQLGELLAVVTPDSSGKKLAYTLSVRDIRTNKQLWERTVEHEVPQLYYSRLGRTLTLVIADYDNIKAEAKEDPSLSGKLNAIEGKKGKKDSYVIKAFDAFSGKNLGAILVDTGNLSFKVRWATTSGDSVFVGDSKNRILVYSLKSGEQKGKIFGRVMAVSKTGDRVLVDKDKGQADLYDVASLQPVAHFSFPSWTIRAEFADDGNSISVLTADQNVYSVKNPGGLKQEATTGNR